MARYKHPFHHWIEEYFSFTKWQRRALLILILLIVLVAILPTLYPYISPNKPQAADAIVLQKVEELVVLSEADSSDNDYASYEHWREPARESNSSRPAPQYFRFDPNTATAADLARLGIYPKTIQTILKYRDKGGRFRKPEDLLKIYSLPKPVAEKLIPWVTIAPEAVNERHSFRRDSLPPNWPAKKAPAMVDINLSDTSQWIALPGIGAKLAMRIANFRDKLGGFYSIDQVGETYGLPDSTFQKIKPRLTLSAGLLKRININTATAEELKVHPYFRWNMVNAIVNYRQQHGPYKSVDELLKIMILTPEWLQKVKPYLTV